MTGEKDGMVSMFGPDTWSGKTSQEPSVPTAAKTSKPSSRKSPGSQSRTILMCLCLRRGGGLKPGASSDRWETGLLPIGSTMLNIGEFRNGENGLLSLPTSTDSRLPKFCLTLNCGEKPRIPNPTKLSEILEQNVDPKYNLSQKACQGILNRAAKRGKELPKALLDTLTEQAGTNSGAANVPDGASLEMDGAEILPGEPFPFRSAPGVTGGKGILLQRERTGALSTLNNQSVLA